jgi:hypothetical protein
VISCDIYQNKKNALIKAKKACSSADNQTSGLCSWFQMDRYGKFFFVKGFIQDVATRIRFFDQFFKLKATLQD